MDATKSTTLLPSLPRGPVRHIVWPPSCLFPVILGDWQVIRGGCILAGYDAEEFWRALVVTERIRVPDSYSAILALRHKLETEFYALPVTAPDARPAAK